jgi:hypothetical protein
MVCGSAKIIEVRLYPIPFFFQNGHAFLARGNGAAQRGGEGIAGHKKDKGKLEQQNGRFS